MPRAPLAVMMVPCGPPCPSDAAERGALEEHIEGASRDILFGVPFVVLARFDECIRNGRRIETGGIGVLLFTSIRAPNTRRDMPCSLQPILPW